MVWLYMVHSTHNILYMVIYYTWYTVHGMTLYGTQYIQYILYIVHHMFFFYPKMHKKHKSGQTRMCQMYLSLHQCLHKCYRVMEDPKVLSDMWNSSFDN